MKMIALTVKVDSSLIKKLKMFAIEDEKRLSDIVNEAFNQFIENKEKGGVDHGTENN